MQRQRLLLLLVLSDDSSASLSDCCIGTSASAAGVASATPPTSSVGGRRRAGRQRRRQQHPLEHRPCAQQSWLRSRPWRLLSTCSAWGRLHRVDGTLAMPRGAYERFGNHPWERRSRQSFRGGETVRGGARSALPAHREGRWRIFLHGLGGQLTAVTRHGDAATVTPSPTSDGRPSMW